MHMIMMRRLDVGAMPWGGRVQVYNFYGVPWFKGTYRGWKKMGDETMITILNDQGKEVTLMNKAVVSLEATGNIEDNRLDVPVMTMY